MVRHPQLGYRKILLFWLPLAATWLMMSVEGPYIAAIIARLPQPKFNLAAYGVAFSFALIIEAPIIMMMSASTALVRDRHSYLKLRNFTWMLNLLITLMMILVLVPPLFYFLTETLIGLPEPVARLTRLATLILLPWPGAIGYRRFYQGILIRGGLTRRVAYGTVVRLLTMSLTAGLLYLFSDIPGVAVGASALSAGVTAEALASRWMARVPVRQLLHTRETAAGLSYRGILTFYYPLALTSMLSLGVHPMVTFFVGKSRMPLESLAVLPVVTSFVFIFRGVALSFQEVAIALLGAARENFRPLRDFAAMLSVLLVGLLALIAFTPLATLWYRHIAGLAPDLAAFAIPPTRIMTLMPGLTLLLSFQRAMLVVRNHTRPITVATLLEVGGIIGVLFLTIEYFHLVGAVAATLGFIIGRLLANLYLFIVRGPGSPPENS